jgi:hypothetical protein
VITTDIERLSWMRNAFGTNAKAVGNAASGEPRGKDKSVVSAEARKLHAELEGDPLERVRTRIRSGFYSRREILVSIADAMTPDALLGTPSV